MSVDTRVYTCKQGEQTQTVRHTMQVLAKKWCNKVKKSDGGAEENNEKQARNRGL
ncbi:hypothetical protein H8L32_09665 [Undibacterium sp. CY18W]|uniref:Uncharacterized protein n=1 Tax=Undibacterium hunanense TaxID=2762292 RepID=A0ABR6ZQC9_9BURK|nr:hypothetical protein [Undibacterium hunanense]MBC3917738.1 hypothetical protein [Undibacterium hunanense]